MRKPSRSFTVEVKRRPTSLAKKPSLVEPPAPVPAPPAASVVFAPVEPAPTAVAEAQRRILPCLVTEAAIDAAKVAGDDDAVLAPRKPTRRINVGKVAVGGGAQVSVQSMTTTKTTDSQGGSSRPASMKP